MKPDLDAEIFNEIRTAIQQLLNDSTGAYEIADAVLGQFAQEPINVIVESQRSIGTVAIDFAQRARPVRIDGRKVRFSPKVNGADDWPDFNAVFIERQIVYEILREAADLVVVTILLANEHFQRRARRPRRFIRSGAALFLVVEERALLLRLHGDIFSRQDRKSL